MAVTKSKDKENQYQSMLNQIRDSIKVGNYLRKWSGGIWYYKILSCIPLQPCQGKRTIHIIADMVDGKPPANKRVWSFSDAIQFAQVELHEREFDGSERIVVVPTSKP